MTNRERERRSGMTLTELLVGMIILAIVGLGMVQIMMAQARYFSYQKSANTARNTSRGPLNRVVSDLRMVESNGGVTFASDTAVQMRVPFAIGVVCGPNGGGTHISLLPVDSAMYAAPGYTGYAWRGGDGVYHYVPDDNYGEVGNLQICNDVQIVTLTSQGARIVKINPQLPDTASFGTPVLLFRNIRYAFRPSQAVPGTVGLFRSVTSAGLTEELSAPYDAGARFRFYIGGSTTAVASPPADLSTLRGIQLDMPGMSERAATRATAKHKVPFTTAIFFKNRLN